MGAVAVISAFASIAKFPPRAILSCDITHFAWEKFKLEGMKSRFWFNWFKFHECDWMVLFHFRERWSKRNWRSKSFVATKFSLLLLSYIEWILSDDEIVFIEHDSQSTRFIECMKMILNFIFFRFALWISIFFFCGFIFAEHIQCHSNPTHGFDEIYCDLNDFASGQLMQRFNRFTFIQMKRSFYLAEMDAVNYTRERQ